LSDVAVRLTVWAWFRFQLDLALSKLMFLLDGFSRLLGDYPPLLLARVSASVRAASGVEGAASLAVLRGKLSSDKLSRP